MRTKLLSLIALTFITVKIKSQCAATQSVGLLVSTTTTVNSNSPFTIKVCSTGFVYDTLCCSSKMYYMEAGSQVRIKGHNTTLFYMQSGSTLTVIGNGTTVIYREPGTTVIGAMNSTTCSAVSFPAMPACGTTGISDYKTNNEINVYPNPSSEYIHIKQTKHVALEGAVYNASGKKVLIFNADEPNTQLNIAGLSRGIYYITLTENGKTVSTKKISVN